MFRILKGLTLLVLCTTVVSAQSSTKKPIEGAWKVTEIVVTGPDWKLFRFRLRSSNVSSFRVGTDPAVQTVEVEVH